MNKAIGIGIALFGGYFLLKAMGVDILGSSVPSATSTSSTTPQASTPISQASNQLITAIYNNIIAAKADPNAYWTVDYWNTFYKAVKGIDGPSPESLFPGVDRNNTYTFSQYAAGLVKQGLSGLGVIAHFVNPYKNFQGTPMGSNLIPTGFEKFIVTRNN